MTDNEALDKFQQMVGCPHKWADDPKRSNWGSCLKCGTKKSYLTKNAPDVRMLWGAGVAAHTHGVTIVVRFDADTSENIVFIGDYDVYPETEHAACAAIARAVIEYKEQGE